MRCDVVMIKNKTKPYMLYAFMTIDKRNQKSNGLICLNRTKRTIIQGKAREYEGARFCRGLLMGVKGTS